MNPIILPPPVKLRLKIELVSYPARAEGLGKYDNLKWPIILKLSHLSFSLAHTHFLSLPSPFSLSFSHWFFLTFLSLTLTLSHPFSHFPFHCHSLSNSFSHPLSYFFSFTNSHLHFLSHSFSLSLPHTHFLSITVFLYLTLPHSVLLSLFLSFLFLSFVFRFSLFLTLFCSLSRKRESERDRGSKRERVREFPYFCHLINKN